MKTTTEALFWAKVAKTEGCWEWTAGTNGQGYGMFAINRRPNYAHRVSYELEQGAIPEGMVIDHMCHNTLCVNPDHLRAVTTKQNLENHRKAYRTSKSGVLGVHWNKNARKWQAIVSHNGKQVHVGYFHDLAEAGAAAAAKRNELFTHNDHDKLACQQQQAA